MTDYSINSYDDAVDFANRLVKFAASKKFIPMKLETNWGKFRSGRQSRWYFRSIGKYILPGLQTKPEMLSKLITRALGNGLDIAFIHGCLKLIYLQGGSTRKLDTTEAAKLMSELRHDFLHEYGIYIPEPPI